MLRNNDLYSFKVNNNENLPYNEHWKCRPSMEAIELGILITSNTAGKERRASLRVHLIHSNCNAAISGDIVPAQLKSIRMNLLPKSIIDTFLTFDQIQLAYSRSARSS